jgi:hypothetical protein
MILVNLLVMCNLPSKEGILGLYFLTGSVYCNLVVWKNVTNLWWILMIIGNRKSQSAQPRDHIDLVKIEYSKLITIQ